MDAKRLIDIVLSGLALLILSPLMGALALLSRAVHGAPVSFRQVRPGRFGLPFSVIKFRTMTNELGPDGKPLPDGLRKTWLGSLMRRLSVDEIPQLWNVLKGDMSLVGPRPLLMEYLPLYSPREFRRHEVRPGITGWAQVNGRNAISWEAKFDMDVWYVDNRSVWLDFRIMLLTIRRIAQRTGIDPLALAGDSKFTGSGCRE